MNTIEKTTKYVLATYGRFPLALTRGQGARVWDDAGRERLDFCAGIATCSLGHCHPALVRAITQQAEKLIHCSNLYYVPGQAELAELIVERVVRRPGKVFFGNSGAEANDGLIKLARRFGRADGRYEILSFHQSFHGRTFGSMTATAQAKIHEGYDPLPKGFRYLPPNDLEAARAAVGPETAAFLLEPIQGEGGVNVMPREFLEGLAELAREKNVLLMFDEVQCGFGRTGDLNGYEKIAPGICPDAISWAKGMGGGFPIGAFWVADQHAELMGPGSHGSTYGGNPLACAASLAVIEAIISQDLPRNAREREEQIRGTIAAWDHPAIAEVRGHGLLLGIALHVEKLKVPEGKVPSIHLCGKLLEAGLLVPAAGPNTVRLLPPLNVTAEEIDEALAIVRHVLDSLTD